MITLYSLPSCNRCKILKEKMNKQHIDFKEINNPQVLSNNNIEEVPILDVNGAKMNFAEANDWINKGEYNAN